MNPDAPRSPARTLYRDGDRLPPVEYRRVFEQPTVLDLEHRELKPDGIPHNDTWYRVTDSHLLHMQQTDDGAAIVRHLADLPFAATKPTGGAAFPLDSFGNEGMTLRDYLAAHAPLDIPAWFKHVPPPKNFPPLPDWRSVKNRDDQEVVKNWLDDGPCDLPDHLMWFQRAVQSH